MSSQFYQRLWIGSCAIIILIAAIYFSFHPLFRPVYLALNILIISLAVKEYSDIATIKGFKPQLTLSILGTALFLMLTALVTPYPQLSALPFLCLLAVLMLSFFFHSNQQSGSVGDLAVFAFAFVYLTIPLSCVLRITYFFPSSSLEDGRIWLGYLLTVTKVTDVGAFFCGKTFGKTKLAPAISPKKTIEGAIGGIFFAIMASFLWFYAFSSPSFSLSLFQSLSFGFIISILAQIGDLSESLLKRDASVKDSSVLPGLGGILDVVDSAIFTVPMLYLFLSLGWI